MYINIISNNFHKSSQGGIIIKNINLPKDAEAETGKWSEYVKKKEKEKLGQPSVLRKIEKIVEDFSTDINKLWILDIFANSVSKDNVRETADLIFEEDTDIVVDNVQAELEVSEITDMSKKIEENLQVGEAIRTIIAKEELNMLKEHARDLISRSSETVKEGINLLSLFVRDDFGKSRTHIPKKGLERTWKIYNEGKVDIDNLVEAGLVYKKQTSDEGRSFWNYVAPHYSLDLLKNLVRDSSKLDIPFSEPSEPEIKERIEEKEVKEFVKWMHGTEKYIKASNEEEQVREELENKEVNLTLDEFKEIREELVKNNLLIFNYSPKRSNTKSRKEKPATWKYELTKPVIESVPILRWRPEEFYTVR